MRSRTPPIYSEFRGGLNPPNHPLGTPLVLTVIEVDILTGTTNFIGVENVSVQVQTAHGESVLRNGERRVLSVYLDKGGNLQL